jgi:hypothetical protein
MTDPYLQWSAAYPEAAAALRAITVPPPPPPGQGSEARIQSAVRLEAARKGYRLWRNNKGAGSILDPRTGRTSFLRWGLANDSKAVSDTWASADLIGWSPTGQFVSVELKAPGGRVSKAQENWAALVRAGGGMALIVNQEGMLP